MNLSVITPKSRLFDGSVSSVILPGTLGIFQVLANHAPTVSSLTVGNITYALSKQSSSIKIKGGFALIAHNQVTVLVSI